MYFFLIAFLCTFLSNCSANDKIPTNTDSIIYIIPPEGFENEFLFSTHRDNCLHYFYALREKLQKLGSDLKTTTLDTNTQLPKFGGIIVCGVPNNSVLQRLSQYPREKIILLLLEPPVQYPHYYDQSRHCCFGKIYTMFDDCVDNKLYFKLFYPQPSLNFIDLPIPFNQKKFCTMIAGRKWSGHPLSLYNAREQIVHFFEHTDIKNFDLYGTHWNTAEFPSYKGPVCTKKDVLKNYKFCICYENMRDTMGYITEKIFDVLTAGCVPIYYGAKNIADYVDPNCFIAREKFATDEELYSFLKNMSSEQYAGYLKAAKQYLASEKAYYFSTDYFVSTLTNDFFLG